MTTQPLLTWDEICQQYPNVWVMVGYPEEEAKKRDWKQSKGIVLYFKTDRADFTPYSETEIEKYKAQKAYAAYYTNFTGIIQTQEKQIRAGTAKLKQRENE